MTRRSDGGTINLGKATPKKLEDFVSEITKAGYEELSAQQKLENIVINQVVLPEERTTVENVKQREFAYYNSEKVHGYYAKLNSGILGEKFIDRGSPNIGIYTYDNKRLLYWKFNKNIIVTLVFRLGAYAKLAKNVIDRAPKEAKLVREKEVGFFWLYEDGRKIAFDYRDYLHSMTKDEIAFIKASYRQTNKWLEKTRPAVLAKTSRRREDILRINPYKKRVSKK